MSEGEQPDETQKTEEPTAKKLEESRNKGQVALSREINNWVMICAGTIILAGTASWVFGNLADTLKTYLENAHSMPGLPGGMRSVFGDLVLDVVLILAPIFLFLFLAAITGPIAQIGPLFAPESLKISADKISPVKGFERLFSMRSLMEFAKGIFKLGLIATVGFILIYPFFDRMELMINQSLLEIFDTLYSLALRLLIGILIALLVVAVFDFAFQKQEHHKKMKMTKQEVKDEFRQAEGDPQIKAKLRQLRGDRAQQRIAQAVPEADVVITNPTHFAVVLKYDPQEMEAPLCTAKGRDNIALKIRELAEANDIIIYENPPLARALFETVEIDQSIPPEQYQAVAEVISFVFKQKGRI